MFLAILNMQTKMALRHTAPVMSGPVIFSMHTHPLQHCPSARSCGQNVTVMRLTRQLYCVRRTLACDVY